MIRINNRFLTPQALLFTGVTFLTAYLTLIPLMVTLYGSFRTSPPGLPSSLTLANYVRAFSSESLLGAIGNSVFFASCSATLSLVLGTFLAWITERTDAPLKRLIYAGAAMSIIAPGVLIMISWVLLLSPQIGLLNLWLKQIPGLDAFSLNIFSMGGIIWAFGSDHFPLAFLLMAAGFRSMDPALEEAAFVAGSGPTQTQFRITAWLLLPYSLAAWMLLFIRGIETFEAPAILGLPAKIFFLSTEIYFAVNTSPPDYNLATTYSVVYLLVAFVGMGIYLRVTRASERYATITGKGYRPRIFQMGRWRWPLACVGQLLLALSIWLPLLIILWASLLPWYSSPSMDALGRVSLENYRWILNFPVVRRAFLNNLIVGTGSATSVVLLTSVIAWIVIRSRIPGRKLLDVLAFAPICFPGIVVGLSILWLYLLLPIPIYGTLWMLFLAYTGKYTPISMRACYAGLSQVHSELEDASSACGAGWGQTFFRIVTPLIFPSMIVGWVYVLSLTFKVLSLPILLSGPGNEVLPVLIFDLYDGGDYTKLNALGVLIIGFVTMLSLAARTVGYRIGIDTLRS
ncbi:MAG: ABC transporter permease [Candidatus Binatia bacterium]